MEAVEQSRCFTASLPSASPAVEHNNVYGLNLEL